MFAKLIVVTDPITEDPVTALIEATSKYFAITTLDGKYDTIKEFEEALEETIQAVDRDEDVDKALNFFPTTVQDAFRLYGVLTAALEAAEKAEG